MVYLVLYLVGALLFVNGMICAGVITAFSPVAGAPNIGILTLGFSASGVADLNLIIGAIMVILAILIIAMDTYKGFGDTVSAVVSSAVLTFAIAYLLLGFGLFNMYNPEYAALAKAAVTAGAKPNPFVGFAAFQPLGWYSLPMSVFVFICGLGYFHIFGSHLPKVPQFGLLWISYAIAFFLFFWVFGLGNFSALTFTGWYCVAISIVTIAYPALAYFNAGAVGVWYRSTPA
ncbi:MAG: hypothetical protein M0Z81_11960 [Deltaproteobacteria bacterium]|jgi:hypothetical protein|nr:hypothetical protein [Deltaproteobacteria bacterium]